MKTQVIVKFGVPGFHSWPEAPEPVKYLSSDHRHIFGYRIGVVVTHGDRDVEFHLLQTEAITQLHEWPDCETYGVSAKMFGPSSCELLALKMYEFLTAKNYDVSFVEVWEDDECGARVEP